MLLGPIPSFYRGTISVPPILAKLPHRMQKRGGEIGPYILGAWDLNFSHG